MQKLLTSTINVVLNIVRVYTKRIYSYYSMYYLTFSKSVSRSYEIPYEKLHKWCKLLYEYIIKNVIKFYVRILSHIS